MEQKDIVLKVEDLHTVFHNSDGPVKVLEGVSFELKKGHTLGLVGESGSGKSVTSLSIMGLFQGTKGAVEQGHIFFEGTDILPLSERERRKLRGREISMIFQEPMTSLNPVKRIGVQLREAIRLHEKLDRKQAEELSVEMLKKTGLPRSEEIMKEYPFQLSGGQLQRVMIAMALLCRPKILIADEPTTALDVTIQAQILSLIGHLKREIGTSTIFITHDLGVVAEVCDEVAVMYCGRIVEAGPVREIFHHPAHPYTKGLMEATPRLGAGAEELASISGNVPNPRRMPPGCKFAPRCPMAEELCSKEEPGFYQVGEEHTSRCWLCREKGGGMP